eukprot:3773628-Pleurochrysis_carterae.AAC.4
MVTSLCSPVCSKSPPMLLLPVYDPFFLLVRTALYLSGRRMPLPLFRTRDRVSPFRPPFPRGIFVL